MAASLEAQARNKSDPAPKMAALFGPSYVQDGCDFRAGPRLTPYRYAAVPPEALGWLSQSCGLRSRNMTPMDLKTPTNSPLFLPYIEKGGNPIEDAPVGKVMKLVMHAVSNAPCLWGCWRCVFRRT